MRLTPEEFAALIPPAVEWAEEQEHAICTQGTPLSASQFADALAIGIAAPQRVRVLAVPEIPGPRDPALAAAADAVGLNFPSASGFTYRYGIYLRADRASDRQLLAHELVHTRQYERLGGIENFLRQYLLECVTFGYARSPLEIEAIAVASQVCR